MAAASLAVTLALTPALRRTSDPEGPVQPPIPAGAG
jgi:hypothetical protein